MLTVISLLFILAIVIFAYVLADLSSEIKALERTNTRIMCELYRIKKEANIKG